MSFGTLRRAWWPAVSVILTGCATTGHRSYDAASYDALHADAERVGVVDQRQRAADDEGLVAPVLERTAYVRAVLHRNLSLEAARQGWRAAVARVRQSGTLDDPMVTVEVAPISIGASNARFGYTAMISQRLPWPGKLALDETVAQAEVDAAKGDYAAGRTELALAATVLYDQYFVAARSLEITASHIDLMRTMRAGAAAQFEAGRGSVQDALQAEFELTHMEHDSIIVASQRDVTVAQMNELLHRAPDLPLPPPSKELPLPSPPDVGDVGRLQTLAVDRRPEIAAARDRARAQEARAERARRESFPDVTVSTSYNSMWDIPEHRWMVGLTVNLPVHAARRAGAVDEANASRAQHEADAARMGDLARTQVVVALKQLEEADHVLSVYEQRLLPIARDEVDAARAAFTASRTPFVSAVDAEKNLRSVELDEQIARAEYDRKRAELDRALGRTPGLDGEVIPR